MERKSVHRNSRHPLLRFFRSLTVTYGILYAYGRSLPSAPWPAPPADLAAPSRCAELAAFIRATCRSNAWVSTAHLLTCSAGSPSEIGFGLSKPIVAARETSDEATERRTRWLGTLLE